MNKLRAGLNCLIISVLLLKVITLTGGMTVKLTKVACNEFDKTFGEFKNCSLKPLSRDKASLSLYIRLYKAPVTKITINAELLKRDYTQKYKSFMYNETVDFCKFLKTPKRYGFWNIVYTIIKPYSNINHTCPFTHDIILDNFIMDASMFKMIPFPSGDYMVRTLVSTYNIISSEVRVYFEVKE